jgi:hypothetical protein
VNAHINSPLPCDRGKNTGPFWLIIVATPAEKTPIGPFGSESLIRNCTVGVRPTI